MNYSMDLRRRVINWVRSGKSRLSASQVFKVHYQYFGPFLNGCHETLQAVDFTHVN